MKRVVILKADEAIGEVSLEAETISIGRDKESDIRLDGLAVSRRHARLVRQGGEYHVEDLDSTNGTLLNDRQVRRHVLRDGDVLGIGGFRLRFLQGREDARTDPNRTVLVNPGAPPRPPAETPGTRGNRPRTAALRFFRGPRKGRTESIQRGVYTIGRPGGDVAAIACRPQGFFLLYIGGERYPRINGREITTSKGVRLQEGDVLEVGENMAEISFR